MIRPAQGIRQKARLYYEYEDGVIDEQLTYFPGQIDSDTPTYYEESENGERKERRELLHEWFDRCTPHGTFVDDQGNPLSAKEFAEAYPDNLFLMRQAQIAIMEDHNPFTRARRS